VFSASRHYTHFLPVAPAGLHGKKVIIALKVNALTVLACYAPVSSLNYEVDEHA
jgi:hypothetical protein